MIELAIVVPTFNEKDNVVELVTRLERVLDGIQWEVLFVDDDSPDCTSDRVRDLAQLKSHVRCVQRIGRRGLSRAVIEGILLPRRRTLPLWTPTCSTTKRCYRRCWKRSELAA